MMTIGELTRRTGVTEKALRLYERRGLLSPDRTASGRRTYGETDVTMLQRVLVLKRLGCTLSRIGELMNERELDAGALLDLQLESVESERRRLGRLARTLNAARKQLNTTGRISVPELCQLLRVSEQAGDRGSYAEILGRWFTVKEQQQWREAAAASGAQTELAREQWDELFERVDRSRQSGLAPDSPEAMALAVEWIGRQQQLMTMVGPDLWNRGAAMFKAAGDWGTDGGHSSRLKAIYAYAFAAGEAAKRAGLMQTEAKVG